MTTPIARTVTLVALVLALADSVVAGPQVPDVPKPTAGPPPAPSSGDAVWDEQKLRAREDVEYLEIYRKAKLAECREAELRAKIFVGWKIDLDRQKDKGLISAFQWHQGELQVAETETQLEVRRAETKDVEIRLGRARRRLQAIERSPSEAASEAFRPDDRQREQELRFERLRDEFERTKRVSRSLDLKQQQ